MFARKAHTVPYNELCHHLWDSSAPSVHTQLYNPVGPGQFCALPSECLALWQRKQLNVSVRHASPVVDILGAQVTTCQHKFCHCWKPCAISMPVFMVLHIIHTPSPPGSGVSLCYTHHTQKSKHTSYFKVCHFSAGPSISNLTYLCYPLIAVQWHNLHVPITYLNPQSHDTISCQTCCYLIFWNFLLYLSEVENSKYGTRNTSTTGSTIGMNKGIPLILNNNHAIAVTDEVREITWFYKQT